MWLGQSKGAREKGKKDRNFSSTCGTQSHDLLLSRQAHYRCAKGEAAIEVLWECCSAYSSSRARFMVKLEELLRDRYADFKLLNSVERTSCIGEGY